MMNKTCAMSVEVNVSRERTPSERGKSVITNVLLLRVIKFVHHSPVVLVPALLCRTIRVQWCSVTKL